MTDLRAEEVLFAQFLLPTSFQIIGAAELLGRARPLREPRPIWRLLRSGGDEPDGRVDQRRTRGV